MGNNNIQQQMHIESSETQAKASELHFIAISLFHFCPLVHLAFDLHTAAKKKEKKKKKTYRPFG